ncbi:MAG: phosphoenolpyruvate synthase [Candidatus Rokubacteria bacterium RIFCSPHIGHO2_02_FULL_73_26]|nr:MAG: phosphoenolpyruvate synthase [Candidatus Rokubacteria bacterium RIFCSPHIGHO2_02_FULL_73_26]
MTAERPLVVWLGDLDRGRVAEVGGKNASLGEMLRHLAGAGIHVPDGFATTAEAYWRFVDANDLRERIAGTLEDLKRGRLPLARAGRALRRLFTDGAIPPELAEAVAAAYRTLGERIGRRDPDVAVRSSATAEDLPEASFAGQQESFLNVRGERALLRACRRCLASLFTDRAIVYRENHGFDHLRVALSVGVQRMVRADRGAAGVMFSIDTETGFPRVVLINAAWGLGETVVQGTVNPDEYMVFKPLLVDPARRPIVHRALGAKARKLVYARGHERPTRLVPTSRRERAAWVLDEAAILQLARWAVAIEAHYGRPMDMEWARDGATGEIFIVQARPETVEARRQAAAFQTYRLTRKGKRLLSGLAIGDAVAMGAACVLRDASEIDRFVDDAVLVTGMTDPDWVPIMKRAAAIVTDHGGRTSHAAIVSRELGLPAIVGTGRATRVLRDGQVVTVSCAEGSEGFVYEGRADVEVRALELRDIPTTRTRVMLNLANPAAALRWWRLPADGVGLARMEFIINAHVKVHPMALVRFDRVRDRRARRRIEALTRGYRDKPRFFVDALADGIARIAAAHHPRPVIVRTSDFKTNEYAALIGGRPFEPEEENPMLGWRGASRYASEGYREGFALECQAIRRVREEMGLANVIVMIPFCRTLEEADRTLGAMAAQGLRRGEGGLEVYVMCEIPSNVILAEEFAERFDGFSIGSNDLTQLTLGVDRDSARLAGLFDEENPAVTRLIEQVIRTAHARGRKVGLCGQAPSDRPRFARFLVRAGIDSISVTPDSFIQVKQHVAAAEAED